MKPLFKSKAFLLQLGIILSLLTWYSCSKISSEPKVNNNFTNLVINQSFKFSSTEPVNINFKVNPNIQNEAPHIFKVFQGSPLKGGKMLAQGMTDSNYEYSVTLNLPERLDSLFVENTNANGIYEVVGFPLSSNTINLTFNTKDSYLKHLTEEKASYVDPGCGDDCEETISGIHTDLELEKSDFCVLDGTTLNVSGKLSFKRNSTLVICGDATISEIENGDNSRAKIYVSAGGSLTIPSNLAISGKIDIYNWGTVTINGFLSNTAKGKFYNKGTITIAGDFTNGVTTFQNDGTMTIGGDYTSATTNRGKNYGTMDISGDVDFSATAMFYNYCKFLVDGDMTIVKKYRSYAYTEVGGTMFIPNKGLYQMNAALTVVNNLNVTGRLQSITGNYSKVVISSTTTFNSGAQIQNRVDICDSNGVETNNASQVSNKVLFDCSITIPESGCNPGHSGGSGTLDTDNDGVPDVNDLYVEDSDRAFESYYPNTDDYATFAFEDLWPGLGDYDFNDVVVDIQYQIITNADNKIVDIITSSHMRAAGATLNNGFGISFPTPSANCESITGYRHATTNLDINAKGYENGHTGETVAILYDAISSIYNMTLINTDPTRGFVETDTITVATTFSIPTMDLGQEPYNPFIYINQERGKEVHLIDHEPTDLVDASYFGTSHDNSLPAGNRYYVTERNLPWAIEIPVSFDYPIEKSDILNTHLKFSDWATSSGANFQDWYMDKPGYREADNIYERP